MPKHVVIDPVTRIEGHLRAEVQVDDSGKVTDDETQTLAAVSF